MDPAPKVGWSADVRTAALAVAEEASSSSKNFMVIPDIESPLGEQVLAWCAQLPAGCLVAMG